MLEVIFSDSAAGCLKVASGNGNYVGGVSSAIIVGKNGDDQTADQKDIQKMISESEERERLNWGKAIPLNIERKDILCFPLALSTGDITEDGIGKQRLSALQMLVSIYPDEVMRASQDMFTTAQKSFEELLSRVENGESIRVWTSNVPDDACGLCWMIEQLKHIGFEHLDITCVKLPEFHVMPDNTVVTYSGWGEVAPHQWGHLALLGQKLPADYMHGLSLRWQQLKKENAPLRAVVNRSLVSVPESFYDSFILQELDAEEDEFMEARVIGKVLGKYSLGISDSLVAIRIEQFIKDGMLKAVTHAGEKDPAYHRILKKLK